MDLKSLIQLNRELRESLTSHLMAHRSGPNDGRLWPLLFLAVQVWRQHEALELLAERGFGREAGILLRSMFEATVNAVWISKDLDVRIQRYTDYQYISAQKYRDIVKRWNSGKQLPASEQEQYDKESEDIRREAKRVKRKYGFYKGTEYWSGKTLRAMAEDIGWLERYDFMYRIYSDIIHAGVAGSHDYVSQIPSGGMLFNVGPQFEHSEACLQEAYLYLTATFEVANDFLMLGMEAQLDKAWANMPKVLPEAPDSTGGFPAL